MKKQIRKFFSFFISVVLFANTFVMVMAHPYDVSDELALRNACKIATKYDCRRIAPGFNRKNLENFKCLCERRVVQVDNVLKDVSIRYTLHKQTLKEDFILHSRNACNSFLLRYYIADFEAYQLDSQTISLYDKNQNKEVIIAAPYMEDSLGKRSRNVCLKINSVNNGILIASLTADYNWLQSPERQYPVRIDPEYRFPENDLQEGNSGDDVYVLKNMLFEAGFGAGIPKNEVLNDMQSNVYTSITRKFVEEFQKRRGLTNAKKGVADQITRDELRSYLEKEKHVLDTAEHIKEFSKRINKRSQKRGFLSRINGADVATSLAISVGSIALGVTCLPFVATGVGIAGVVAGCVAMGTVASGISEVVQQRQAGEKIDIGRVAIKSTFGAVQGALSAIPGVSMGKAVGSALEAGGQVIAESIAANQVNTVATGILSATTSSTAKAITREVMEQAALETGKVLVKAGAKEVAVTTVAAVGTNTVGNIACKAKSGEKIDKEAVIDSLSQGLADAAMIPVGAVVNVAAVSVLGDKKCPQNEEKKEKDKDEKKEKQKEEILHKELFSKEKNVPKTEDIEKKFDIIGNDRGGHKDDRNVKLDEHIEQYIKDIHNIIKGACKYQGEDSQAAALEEINVCLEMKKWLSEILNSDITSDEKNKLEFLNLVLENRVEILENENGIGILERCYGASCAAANPIVLRAWNQVRNGTKFSPSFPSTRFSAFTTAISIPLSLPSTCNKDESKYLDEIKRKMYPDGNVGPHKYGHQSKTVTPPQTQIHSNPHKQKVVHKPQTQSKKTHTSQKVDKIPKGKSRKITVKVGDTPSGLAKKYGVSEEDVMKGAGITDPKKLIAGKTITVTNGGGSVSKTKQFKSTETNTGTGHGSRKTGGGGSQPPKGPGGNGSENGPPKGPSGNGSGSRKPPSEEEKKILKDGLKATGGAVLKYAEEHNPELVEKGKELLTEVEEAAAEAKDKVVEVIPEIVSEAKETVTNVVSESGKIVNDVFNFTDVTTRHMQERGRKLPIQVLKDAIETGYSVLDPQNSSNAKMYYKTICVNNKPYNLEVLYDKATNTILHFLYTSEAIGNLPAIK